MQVTNKFIDLNTYVFTFGKHKNRSIQDILDEEASYILWCHDNIDWFKLSDVDYDKVDAEADRQGNSGGIDPFEHDWMGGYSPWSDIGDIY